MVSMASVGVEECVTSQWVQQALGTLQHPASSFPVKAAHKHVLHHMFGDAELLQYVIA